MCSYDLGLRIALAHYEYSIIIGGKHKFYLFLTIIIFIKTFGLENIIILELKTLALEYYLQ